MNNEEQIETSIAGDKDSSSQETKESILVPMKKRLKRLEVMNIVLLVLVSVLVYGTFNPPIKEPTHVDQVQGEQKMLPSSLSTSKLEVIAQEFSKAYNSGDNNELYKTLGPFAQTLISKDDLADRVGALRILGDIEKTAYSHYEFLGYKEGADWFSLNYIAKYSNGDGTLKINIRVVDDQWQVVGFYLNVDQLENKKD